MVSVSLSPHRKWVTANQQRVPSFPASVGKWDLICQITVKTTVIQTIPTTVTSCINHEGRGLIIWMTLQQPISSQYFNPHSKILMISLVLPALLKKLTDQSMSLTLEEPVMRSTSCHGNPKQLNSYLMTFYSSFLPLHVWRSGGSLWQPLAIKLIT